MVKHMRVMSARNFNKRAAQITNKYAAYIARQESTEIDNALFTLDRIQCSSQKKNSTKISVHERIVAQK